MLISTKPAFTKCWQAAAMGTLPIKGAIPIDIGVFRQAARGMGLRSMPRDEANRKKFAHPMFPRTFMSIDEQAMIVEIAADSESYIAQFATDLKLPRYRKD